MTPQPRILVVEDDPQVQRLLLRFLESQGMRAVAAGDGAAMRRELRNGVPDVIILDIGLPGEDGFSLARELRATSRVGLVMLTERSDTVDVVVGLEVGADDYISKPFELRELGARLKSLLRRLRERDRGELTVRERARFSGWELDTAGHLLCGPHGREVAVTAKEFALLKLFLAQPGRALSRDRILDHLNPDREAPFDRSVDVLIHQLRGKLEEDPRQPRLIKTIRGAGYALVCEVTWS